MNAEVVSQPMVMNVAPMPESLLEWAAEAGKCVALANAGNATRALFASLGKFALLYEELPDHVQKELRRVGYSSAKQFDGEIRIGDCALFVQSLEQRERWREHWDGLQAQQEQAMVEEPELLDERWAASTAANNPVTRGKPLIHISGVENHSVRQHTMGGRALAEEVQQKLASAETGGKKRK